MGKLLTLCACTTLFASLALAETWTGRLIDANCYDQQTEQKNVGACAPTNQTSSFGLYVMGKMFRMDEQGNTKAAAAIRDRADRSSDPAAKIPNGDVTATITGTMNSEGVIKVDKVEVQ